MVRNMSSEAEIKHKKYWILLRLILLIYLLSQPLLVFMIRYNAGDSDDKAVHYYSSAYVGASAESRTAVRAALPAWLTQEESLHRKQRVYGRVVGAHNYTALNGIMRWVRHIAVRSFSDASPDQILSFTYRVSCWLLLFCVLLYSVGVGWRCSGSAFPLLITLTLSAFGFLGVNGLAQEPTHHYHSFVTSSPRGAGAVIILALLFSFVSKRKILFVLSAVILGLCHAGLSMSLFPVLIVVLLLSERSTLFKERSIRNLGSKLFYPLFLVVLLVASSAALRVSLGGMPFVSEIPVGVPGSSFLSVLPWLSALVAVMCVIGAVERYMTEYSSDTSKSYFFSRVISLHLIFILVAGLWCALCQTWALQTFISHLTNTHLIHELPGRLAGARYLAFVSLCTTGGWALWEWGRGKLLPRERWLVAGLALTGLVVLTAHQQYQRYSSIGEDGVRILQRDCLGVEVKAICTDSLRSLDTHREPEFFLSLAELLYEEE